MPLVGVVEEGVVEALFRRRPLARVERQHGDEPVGEALRHLGVPLVLLGEDVVEAPRLQLRDVAKLTWGVETGFSNTEAQTLRLR